MSAATTAAPGPEGSCATGKLASSSSVPKQKTQAVPEGFRAIAGNIVPWRPDMSKCKVCDVKFTIFNHRHKCRNCHEPVCNPCARSRKVLRAYTPPKRICDTCIDKFWTPKKSPADATTASPTKPTDRLSLTLPTPDADAYQVDAEETAPLSPGTPAVFFGAGPATLSPVLMPPPTPAGDDSATTPSAAAASQTRRGWGAFFGGSGGNDGSSSSSSSGDKTAAFEASSSSSSRLPVEPPVGEAEATATTTTPLSPSPVTVLAEASGERKDEVAQAGVQVKVVVETANKAVQHEQIEVEEEVIEKEVQVKMVVETANKAVQHEQIEAEESNEEEDGGVEIATPATNASAISDPAAEVVQRAGDEAATLSFEGEEEEEDVWEKKKMARGSAEEVEKLQADAAAEFALQPAWPATLPPVPEDPAIEAEYVAAEGKEASQVLEVQAANATGKSDSQDDVPCTLAASVGWSLLALGAGLALTLLVRRAGVVSIY